MPYASAAQRGWAHTAAGTKALGGAAKVREWDSASRGMKLPKHVKPKTKSKPKRERVFGSLAPSED